MRVQKLGLLNGNYEDFTTDWYGTVGVTFVLIAIVDNATHYMSTLAKPLKLTIKRWFFSGEVSGRGAGCSCFVVAARVTLWGCVYSALQGKRVNQRDMNKLYVGEEFNLSERLPQVWR